MYKKMSSQLGHPNNYFLIFLLILFLSACSTGGDGESETQAWVRIDYPTPGLSTGLGEIVAKGNAAVRDVGVYPNGTVYWYTNSSSGVAKQSTICIVACIVAWEATVPLDIGENTLRVTFLDGSDEVVFNRYTQVVISGVVTIDSTIGAGVADIPVTIAGPSVNLRTTTDMYGNYSFSGIVAGTYTISLEQPPLPQSGSCLTFDAASREVTVPADDNSDIAGQDFIVKQAAPCYSVQGRVTASTNPSYGQSNIKITLSDIGGNEMVKYTDISGYFSFYHFEPGVYTLTPSNCWLTDCSTFTPDSRVVTVVDGDVVSQDFLRNY